MGFIDSLANSLNNFTSLTNEIFTLYQCNKIIYSGRLRIVPSSRADIAQQVEHLSVHDRSWCQTLPMPACMYMEDTSLAAVLATKR